MTASDATFGDSPGSLWMPVILTESTLSPVARPSTVYLSQVTGAGALGAAGGDGQRTLRDRQYAVCLDDELNVP